MSNVATIIASAALALGASASGTLAADAQPVKSVVLVHGGFVDVDAMFRDINVTRDSRSSVLHEYELKATIDARSGAVASVDARPRVLPWQECPAAMGSAARIVGVPVAHLRQWVGENLGGATTCTHLNEALRVLEDIGYLLEVGRRSTLH